MIETIEEGLVEVPTLTDWNLRHHIFEYIKECSENNIWEGRTTIRISSLAKSLIAITDGKYRINSKTKTTTALLYLGCFRMIDYLDKDQWNAFLESNFNLDMDFLSLCDMIGTDRHNAYYDSKFALSAVGYKWVDNLNNTWPIPDKSQNIYHIYNDSRFGRLFSIFTEKMGYSIKETANMFILYAIKDSDIMPRTEQSYKHLERIDNLLKYNSAEINIGIRNFNNCYSKLYER